MRIEAVGLGADIASRAAIPVPALGREAAVPAVPAVEPGSGGAAPHERAKTEQPAKAPETDRYEPAVEAKPSLETRISVDQATHETYVQVIDADQHQVLMEMPSEKIRELSESLAKAAGAKLDVKA